MRRLIIATCLAVTAVWLTTPQPARADDTRNIVNRIANKAGMHKVQAELALKTILDIITENLVAGKKAKIDDLGVFGTSDNYTGPDRGTIVTFKESDAMMDAVNVHNQ